MILGAHAIVLSVEDARVLYEAARRGRSWRELMHGTPEGQILDRLRDVLRDHDALQEAINARPIDDD